MIRSRIAGFVNRFVKKVTTSKIGQRVQETQTFDKATKIGKDFYHKWEGQRQTFADSLEKEIDLRAKYRQIEEKLAEDLAELEMRKAVLEQEVSGKDRMLFEESYEYARKKIINKRMQEAAQIFHPESHHKVRNDLLVTLIKILRGEKISNTPKENLDHS